MTAPTPIAELLRAIGKQYNRWQRFLAVKLHLNFSKYTHRSIAIGAMVCLVALTVWACLLLSPRAGNNMPPVQTVVQTVATPDLSQTIENIKKAETYTPRHETVRPGETMLSLFAHLGIKDPRIFDFINQTPATRPIVMIQPGQYVTTGVRPDGTLDYLRLYMEGPHDHDSRTIEVMRIGDDFAASVLPFTFTTRTAMISGTARKTLSQTIRALKIPDNIADELPRVWEGAANPLNKLREGDTIRLIYEQKYAEGKFVRDGQLLAIQLVRNNKTVNEAFWFSDGLGAGSFYTLDGRSASQTFLRVPLEIKDVSSEFAPLRRHPITGVIRPHNGTDFRAPSGSRIFAAADGVVTFVGYEAKGYGNYVKVNHGLGRVTIYAHMRKVAPGIKRRVHVKKGDLLGFVGMTGLATGPHLHYELVINGVQINPKTADLPDTDNLSAYQTAQLKGQARVYQQQFEAAAKAEHKPSPQALLDEAFKAQQTERNATSEPTNANDDDWKDYSDGDDGTAPKLDANVVKD